MAKVLVTMTFWYESDEGNYANDSDERDIAEQIETDKDELRNVVKKYGSDIRVEMHDVDVEVQID